jgi:hypothetical protein
MRTSRRIDQWPSIDVVLTELHQLLSVFLASRPIAEAAMAKEELLVDFMDVREHEDSLIARLLLSVATSLRVLDDRTNGKLNDYALEVGSVIKNVPASVDSGVRLTLREACNKVIHAREVELEHTPLSEFCAYLNPHVTLVGRDQRAKAWQATLNVVEFVQEAQIAVVSLANAV